MLKVSGVVYRLDAGQCEAGFRLAPHQEIACGLGVGRLRVDVAYMTMSEANLENEKEFLSSEHFSERMFREV